MNPPKGQRWRSLWITIRWRWRRTRSRVGRAISADD